MPGTPVAIGPWDGGLKNISGFGDFIDDNQAYLLQNFEVDTDGSLVNRPAVCRADIAGFGSVNTDNMRIIGTWITPEQKFLLVVATGFGVHLVQPSTSSVIYTHSMTKPRAMVVYNDGLFIIPTAIGEGGGITLSGSSYVWVAHAPMPTGIAAVVYKDRLYIAQENASRIVYSEINSFITWPGTNNAGIGWDNKQPLKAMILVGSDIYLFKSNSTYRYGHAGDPAKAEIRIMDAYTGTVNEDTVAIYNNNTVYTLSGNDIYELFQGTYTCISKDLDMVRVTDGTFLSSFGVSIFANHLYVRSYNHLYVLNLQTQRWCEWTTVRQFNKLWELPGSEPGEDIAYMASNQATNGEKFVYYTQDSRITGVGAIAGINARLYEQFTCKLITKAFDFATPTYYKTILMGGLSVAASSPVTVSAVVPGSATVDSLTWGEGFVQYTWGSAYDLGLTWGTEISSDGDIIAKSIIPPVDGSGFGRKLLKCLGKFRYRQVQFVIEIPAVRNTKASFSVRLFNLTVYALQKQSVVKSVTP